MTNSSAPCLSTTDQELNMKDFTSLENIMNNTKLNYTGSIYKLLMLNDNKEEQFVEFKRHEFKF
jgi:hypothetical protein